MTREFAPVVHADDKLVLEEGGVDAAHAPLQRLVQLYRK